MKARLPVEPRIFQRGEHAATARSEHKPVVVVSICRVTSSGFGDDLVTVTSLSSVSGIVTTGSCKVCASRPGRQFSSEGRTWRRPAT